MVIALIAASGSVVSASPRAASAPYSFDFEGNPPEPEPWNPSSWDVVVNSRDSGTFAELEGMQVQHGADCSAPPATHFNNTYEGAVFLCRNHVMTAINAGGYGEIVLTPNHMVDISNGAAQVLYSVSTYRASFRDWYDIWFTPFAENLVLPIEAGLEAVDLQGPPKDAIHIRLDQFNGASVFHYEQYANFRAEGIDGDWWTSIESLLTPSAATRLQFEVDLSSTHLRFGIPNLPGSSSFWFVDADLPHPLNSTQQVVQIAHHSYNPTKDCVGPQGSQHCLPDTWHWSNFYISNAVPFTLLRGDVPAVHAGTKMVVNFPAPAPEAGFLRFAGIGSIEVSQDGGKTWQVAVRQAQSLSVAEHFANYWMPVAPGTSNVILRGQDWYGGPWWVRDVAIWSTKSGPTEEGPKQTPTIAPPALVDRALPPKAADGPLLVAAGLLTLAILAGVAYVLRRRRSRLSRPR